MTLFDSEFDLRKVSSEDIRVAVRDKILKIAPERYQEIDRLDIIPQSDRDLILDFYLCTTFRSATNPEDSNHHQYHHRVYYSLIGAYSIDLIDTLSDHIVDILLRYEPTCMVIPREEDSPEQEDLDNATR